MSDIIDCMELTKEWNREDVRAFAALAKSKGISKEDLAKKWLGIHPTTLSDWMSEKQYKEPPPIAKRLMTCIEPRISRMKDKEKK